jgi:hypothetical protein
VQDLASTPGLVAVGAALLALLALVLAIVVAIRLRRVRRDQRTVMGDGSRDLAAHAAALQDAFARLDEQVGQSATALHERLAHAEARLDGAIAYRSLVRYDAYNEMSGRQSTSIALLDASRSGVVLSSIHHRDQARLYVKQVHGGSGELELSPEEAEAVRLALDGQSAA